MSSSENKENIFTQGTDKAIISSDIFAPKASFKELVLDKSKSPSSNNSLLSAGQTQYTPSKQVSFVLNKDEGSEYDADKNDESNPKALETIPASNGEATRIEFDDDGYWTSPSISELKKKSLSELRSVDNFIVGRKHYGQIKFLEPVDLSSFVNLDDITGNLIIFGSKSCIVYPDDNKPQEGEGFEPSSKDNS